jgi:hypothetical protein
MQRWPLFAATFASIGGFPATDRRVARVNPALERVVDAIEWARRASISASASTSQIGRGRPAVAFAIHGRGKPMKDIDSPERRGSE